MIVTIVTKKTMMMTYRHDLNSRAASNAFSDTILLYTVEKNKRGVGGSGRMCHLVKIIARAVEKRYHIYLHRGSRLAGGHRDSRLKPIISPPPYFYTRKRTVPFFF